MNEEAVEAFKRELKNYNYYKLNLEGTLKLIEMNEYLLANVHGLNPEKNPDNSGGSSIWVETETYKRISEELDKLEKRRDLRLAQIEHIESIMSLMDDETRRICERIYRDNESQLKVAKEYKKSRQLMIYEIDKKISKIMQILY